jgi:heterodisulfide reductase subunit A
VKDLMNRSDVLVVGGGPTGLSTASIAARYGLSVTLLERHEKLGGWTTSFGCMATDACNKCSVCSVSEVKAQVLAEPGIAVVTDMCVRDISKVGSDYVLYAGYEGSEEEFRAKALVLATGYQPFDASKRGEFGWGRYPGVLTTLELNQMILEENLPRDWSVGTDMKIAFVQCVGSRDLSLCHEYCSVVCCMTSLRMAGVLRNRFPDINIKFFYMDFQGLGKCSEEFRRAAVYKHKMEFCQAMPSKVYPCEKRLVMRYENSATGRFVEEEFDSVVLAVGICSHNDSFDVHPRDAYGFYVPNHRVSERQGLFVAGTATGPKDITACMRDGMHVALRAVRYVGSLNGGVVGA